VILDVVFNHTNEGNHMGPTISFKGFDNSIYYYLEPNLKKYYHDYSGCGNTLNCNHPIVEKLILECLEFWVEEMHVDGFRFDEGSILSRGENGEPLQHPPVLWAVELSEALADTKLIAEAWDADGLYQIGGFPGYRWAEWNGRFRDDMRKFIKGDSGVTSSVASRISGSSYLYQHTRHNPTNSINFICCHDGFTLMDLVSYNEKHNFANGENNMDGINDNLSWNCGFEGETDNPDIIYIRKRQIKNFFAIQLMCQGVPMIVAGDEFGRTQKGNNNAYCQDNEISWVDWTLLEKNNDLFRFAKNMIAFRKSNPKFRKGRFFSGKQNSCGVYDISWHGCKINSPGWDNNELSVLAFTMGGFEDDEPDVHVMMNMHWETLEFEIPQIKDKNWYIKIDTSKPSPDDFMKDGVEKRYESNKISVPDRTIIVLVSC
jgi:glycogen operon protein